MKLEKGEIFLYGEGDEQSSVEVHLHDETVWLSQAQMQKLFGRERSVITKHIGNVFKEGELLRKRVCAKFAYTAKDGKSYQVEYYNLDVIISVGYRVKSQQGTRFRIWASSVLKDHLLKGYTINQKRLAEKGITEAGQLLSLLKNTLGNQNLVTDEGQVVLDLVNSYAKTWQMLWRYDEDSLPVPKILNLSASTIDLAQTRQAITDLQTELLEKGEATNIFGQERGDGFAGIVGAILQSFGGQDLYPSIQEKAAHLLYFVIKDHPFVDGNKRIGSFLFLLFLRINGQTSVFAPNTMVALTLLVAVSEPSQKDVLVGLILNLLVDQD